jgi:hypothetical protein
VPNRAALDQALARCPAGRRIGLVWAGNPRHPRDRERSLGIADLEPLGRVPDVAWVSLQLAAPALPGFPVAELGPLLTDFADTAHVLDHLDGIVTVDTGIAHLAGAMGKPTWLLVNRLPDWRWLLDREDSPWYPTMRIWRQPAHGDWTSVVAAVAAELARPGFS